MPDTTTKTKKIPAAAFQLDAGVCEFAEATQADGKMRGPIKLTASSGQVFSNYYWGRMVFDFAGMRMAKSKLTLDYCHDPEQVVGYADQIDTSSGKLIVSGELVSAKPDDRAAEILVKGPAGVPYEASVKFDPRNGLVIEEFQAGIPALVNGRTEMGPLTVIRQCLLRGIAVCPYGSDPYTESQFSDDKAASEFEVTINHPLQGESEMSQEQKTATPDEIKSELVAKNKDYADRFGVELAAAWGPLGENKPIVECYSEFVGKLRDEHQTALAAKDAAHAAAVAELQAKLTAAETKATAAEERLSSLSLGEEKPVSGGEQKSTNANPLSGQSAGASAFAAEFALPNKK